MATMQYVRYPTTGGGVGGMTIGGSVTGGTAGSVLFVGAGPVLAQDNANFNYNSGTHALSITGPLSASNLSGTNTGDVTLTAVGASPSANGASLSGQILTLQPADATHPGLLTSGAQSIGGAKTFSSTIAASNLSGTNTGDVTLGTANGLSLVGQVLSYDGIGNAANKTLSNLTSPTAINQDLLPASSGVQNLGTFSGNKFGSINATNDVTVINAASGSFTIFDSTSANKFFGMATNYSGSLATPSGATVNAWLRAGKSGNNSYSAALISDSDGNSNASATGTLRIETGNKTGGTGNSGDISLQTGTSAGGTRGVINLNGSSINANTAKITNVVDPTNPQDAATKNYVDTHGGSAITSLTGDVTGTGPGATAATIASNVVSNAKLAQMPTLTIKGNNTGGTANALDLTVAQVNAILPVFTSLLNGSVPASGGGTTNFLRADGTWAVAGSGTVTSVALADSTGLFNITGSPVTGAGTLTLASLQSQAQHSFFAGPSGASGAPTFRAIVASDVPTLNQNTTGTALNITATSNSTLTTLSVLSLPGSQVTGDISGNAANVTGIVAIANGGTGSATQNFVDLSTNQTIAGAKQFSNALTMTEISTPSTPSAGLDKLYVKSDGNLYLVGSDGIERIVGPGMSGTNATIYTPTITGFGTPTNVSFTWSRVGQNIIIAGGFTSGAPTGVTAEISLPGVLTADAGITTNQTVGSYVIDSASTGAYDTLVSPSATSFNISYSGNIGAGGYTPALGNAIAGNGSKVTMYASFPITGWTVNNGSITNSEVWVTDSDNGANGYGTTNNYVRRFLTPTVSIGTDITYTDDASLGGSFTVNSSGVYSLYYSDVFTGDVYMTIVVNGTQGTMPIESITNTTEVRMFTSSGNNGDIHSGSVTLNLTAGDVIWAQTSNGTVNANAALRKFSGIRIVKIA